MSVVIPTYNRAQMVPRAVRSVLAQDYPDLEVIVVDDGSTDDTADVIDDFATVRYIRLGQNRGGAAARNAGVEAGRGEFVAFLDSDDEWLPTKTSRQVQLMLKSPSTGAVYCRHFAHDDATDTRSQRFPPLYTGSIRPQLLSGKCPPTVSLFLVRRDALEEVGGFDESLAGFQDTDLWIRLSENWEFDAVDEALVVIHRHSGARVTTDLAARKRALDSFFEKWGAQMEGVMGSTGIAVYRRRNMAVAHGALVLSLVESGNRSQAFQALGRYFRAAGLSNLPQAAGLVLACLLGTTVHARLRARFRSARDEDLV